ncbi:hypothetical protein, partial [Phaffia rhodozyma]
MRDLRRSPVHERVSPPPIVPRRSARLSRISRPVKTCPQATILVDIGSRLLPSQPPKTYRQALGGPFRTEWELAMRAELSQFEKLKVWTLRPVDDPETQVISGRWVYTCGPTSDKNTSNENLTIRQGDVKTAL